MASAACVLTGKIEFLAEAPSPDSGWSHWMQHSQYPVYEPIDTEQEISDSLQVLAASKWNAARDWLRVQIPTFITDTGFCGDTLFEVQACHLIYGFKSLCGFFVLRPEEEGLRLIGVAKSNNKSGGQTSLPSKAGMGVDGRLYFDVVALLISENIFHKSGGAERKFLTDIWPRWYTDHTASDMIYLAGVNSRVGRLEFLHVDPTSEADS